MIRTLLFLALATYIHCDVVSPLYIPMTVKSTFDNGFNAYLDITPKTDTHGWKAHIVFDHKLSYFEIFDADIISGGPGDSEFVVQSKSYNKDIKAGQTLSLYFLGEMSSGTPQPQGQGYIESLNGTLIDAGGTAATGTGSQGGGQAVTSRPANTRPGAWTDPPAAHGSYSHTRKDYKKALGLSILFFDAQRSGKMPPNNPIDWRHDSAMGDRGDDGVDLTGGWYDAGDHVKFNLPMSSSAHILAYGLYHWKDAYEAAGQLNQMYDMIKTPLEYFLKCWQPSRQEYYAQVGNGATDHAFWGRPEDMSMWRPAYKCTASNGGCSDVEGGTVAAMAAGSIAFRSKDPAFSNRLLESSKSLYEFAKAHKGIYNKGPIGDASSYYGSNGYNDELCEAAVELYLATGDQKYLNEAKGFHEGGVGWALSWDDKKVFCQLLLYEVTKDNTYKSDVEGFVRSYMPGGSVQQTPCGLAWRDKWGSLRYTGNAAFVACAAANAGIGGDDFKKWAASQINYILGDNKNHISYEIGYGNYFPKQPHHRSSSCPWPPAGCGWDNLNYNGPSPHQLNGALVGGPDAGDNYHDSRNDYVQNEVTCDYNAGFQSALAGLIHFANHGALPDPGNPRC